MRLGILNIGPANKKAQALILGFMVTTFFIVLLTPLFQKIFMENTILNTQKLQREAFYYATGGIEYGTNWFASTISNFQFSPVTGGAIPAPPLCTYANGVSASVSIADSGIAPATIVDPDGTKVIVKPYIFTSICTLPAQTLTFK